MEKRKTIKFLSEKDFKNLRIIRFHGKDYNNFTSFLFYLRDYKHEALDELDNAILETLKQNNEAEFELNTQILFENQLEDIKSKYKLEETKDFTIQLSPIVTDKLIKEMQLGREVYSYLKYFKVSFSKGYKFLYFHNYYLVNLEIDYLENLQNTIQAI